MPRFFLILSFFLFYGFNSTLAQQKYLDEIKESCVVFVNSLSPLQKKSALLAFDDTARVKWNNLPVGMRARAGISIGQMTEPQRSLFHRILSVSLSSQGYLKSTSIFHLDNLLDEMYDSFLYNKVVDSSTHKMVKGLKWSHRNFYLAFFGNPQDARWGFKVEGHHLSLNFSFVNNTLSVSPLFMGTDPAEYPIREYAGWRVLGQEEDLGIKLINQLTEAQKKKAVISDKVPGDIFTAAESGKRLLDYQGITAGEMNAEQKELVKYIIREFVFNLEYEKAVVEYNKILKAGIDKVYFAWIGPGQEDKRHYFMLNGPTFLIEFDNSGFGGQANHIHAIWREKGNEYGEDVLKKHYQSEKH
jgi:hypothetical protein